MSKKPCNSRIVLGAEPSYAGTPTSTTNELPIIESGAGLTTTPATVPSSAVSNCGARAMHILRREARGSIAAELDWNEHGRFLYGLMGAKETDAVTGGYDNFFYKGTEPYSLQADVYGGGLQSTYKGMITSTLSLAASGNALIRLDANYEAQEAVEASYATANSLITDNHVLAAHIAEFSHDGDDLLSIVDSWTLNASWSVSPGEKISATARPATGDMMITITVVCDWTDTVYSPSAGTGVLAKYRTTPFGNGILKIRYNNGLATTSEREMLIYAPSAEVTGSPVLPDQRGRYKSTIEFHCLDADIGSGLLGTMSDGAGNDAITSSPLAFRWSGSENGALY